MTALRNSIVAAILGEEATPTILEEMGAEYLMGIEAFLSQYENLINRAQILELLCEVSEK